VRIWADLAWKEVISLVRSWRLFLLWALVPMIGVVVYQNIRWVGDEAEWGRTLIELNRRQLAASVSWRQVEEGGFYAMVPVRPGWVYARGHWGQWGNVFHVDSGGRVRWVGRQWAHEQWGATIEPLDFTDLLTGVFALMTLLFVYDAVSGERERGTWALLMTTPVGRGTVLLAKGWGRMLPVGLVVTLTWTALFIGMIGRGLIADLGNWVIESLVVLGLAWAFLAGVTLWGLLASVWSRTSAASLTLALAGWWGVTWFSPRYAATLAQALRPPAEPGLVNVSITLSEKQLEERYWRWIAAEWARLGPAGVREKLLDPEQTAEWQQIREDTLRQTQDLLRDAERQTLRYLHLLRLLTLWSPTENFRTIVEHWVGTGWLDVEQAHGRASEYAYRFSKWVAGLRQQARHQYAILLDRPDPFERSRPDLRGLPHQVDFTVPRWDRWTDVWPEGTAWGLMSIGVGVAAFLRFRTARP
jgi:hypothetical protein